MCPIVPRWKPALDSVHRQFGPVQGVIHAAGIAGAGIIQLKTSEAVARVLSAKVQGTLVLESVLKNEPLDFFVLCSSINAICGMPGAVDYTSANAFLDAFAMSRQGSARYTVTSIAWDTWQEVGMAVKTDVPRSWQADRKAALQSGIKPAEGIDAFERALASKLPQVAVITRDLPRILDFIEQFELWPSKAHSGSGPWTRTVG